MGKLTSVTERLFAKTLQREESSLAKDITEEGLECLEAAGISAPRKAKAGAKLATAAKEAAKRQAERAATKAKRSIQAAQTEIKELRARAKLPKSPAAKPQNARQAMVQAFKARAAENPELLLLGLKPKQAGVLNKFLGKLWGSPTLPRGVLDSLAKEEAKTYQHLGEYLGDAAAKLESQRLAQRQAGELLEAIRQHWDAALPAGKTRDDLLQEAWQALQKELQANPQLNAGDFIRKKLFNSWRVRFMQRLGGDEALVRRLREEAGLCVSKAGEQNVPTFRLDLRLGERSMSIGLDVDHAAERLSDAVRDAKSAKDLLPVIDGKAMQLLTPRENRIVIEAERKIDQYLWSHANKPSKEVMDIADELADLIDKLPKGDTF